MSMPINAQPQTPMSGNAAPASTHSSPARAISRSGSASNLAKQQQYSQSQFQLQPSPPAQQPQPFQLTLPADRKMSNPLTTALPMESQQLLAANPFDFSFNDNMPNMSQGAVPQKTYSYNPNGRPASKPSSPTDPTTISQMNMSNMGGMYGMGGMNATLAPSAFDPQINSQSPADSAFSPAGYAFGGMGFNSNDMFSNDMLKEPLGGDSLSGTVTPGEGDWAGFLSNDAWEEQPVA